MGVGMTHMVKNTSFLCTVAMVVAHVTVVARLDTQNNQTPPHQKKRDEILKRSKKLIHQRTGKLLRCYFYSKFPLFTRPVILNKLGVTPKKLG